MVESASATQLLDASSQEITLIRKAVAGDADAFARLYDIYVDELYRFIYYRVSDPQTAEDITSQVFLKAWDNLSRYKFRGLPFNAWLFQIARNAIIDHFRTRKENLPLEPTAIAKPDPSANVAQTVEQRLEGEWLRDMLNHLTDDQKEVLTLKFIHGLSTREVAELMGKRQGAVRALQMRGLQALADLIGDEAMDEDGAESK